MALSADDDVEDDSWGVQLLADLRRIWNPELGLRLFSWELCYLLNEEDGSPWKNWGRNRKVGGFTPRDLAQHLRRYSIKPKTIRVGEVTKKGYDYEDFEDAWARYLPPVEDQEDAS